MKNKSTLIGIIVVVVIVVGAIAAWMVIGGKSSTSTPQTPTSQIDTQTPTAGGTNAGTLSDVTDMTSKTQADVAMSDLSFKPAKIKVKKGTTVTWTNNDTVAHNVVAADASNTGGLPTSAATFGRGGTFSFTFKTVGTFDYLCTPHKSFMHGTVQVVD